MEDFIWKMENADTKRTLRSRHFIKFEKQRKYLSGILYIYNDKEHLGKNKDNFINDKRDFNNTPIIKSNIQHVSKIPEEECFISSMTPIGFRNGHNESRCYVNLSFQVLFYNKMFGPLIMNINCDIMLTNMNKSTEDYNGKSQQIMILKVIQEIFL